MSEETTRTVKTGALAVLALSALFYSYQYARSIDRSYPSRTFSVDGKADVDIVPDIASFSATVMTEGGQDIAGIQKTNSDKMNRVNQFMKDEGIKSKDLKTLQYNLSPRYSNSPCYEGTCPAPTIVGYTLTQTLEVKVRETEKLGNLLSGAVKSGANSVSDVRFVVDDDTEAKNEARAEAIQKAKEKAEAVAKAGGFRLGKLVTLYESGESFPQAYGMGGGAADMAVMKAPVVPTIEPGSQKAAVTVTLTYEIAN
jgi:uncharacterized protein